MVAGRKGCGLLRRETANHRGRALRRHSQLLRLQVTHQASDARTDLEWQPTLLLGRGNVVRMDLEWQPTLLLDRGNVVRMDPGQH